jgi:hypothetical protein
VTQVTQGFVHLKHDGFRASLFYWARASFRKAAKAIGYLAVRGDIFLLASIFISCHNKSTVRRRQPLAIHGRPTPFDVLFFVKHNPTWHEIELPQRTGLRAPAARGISGLY